VGLQNQLLVLNLSYLFIVPRPGNTHADFRTKMEWEEVSFAKCRDDPLQICAPESFFDPRLESLDSFPKTLLTDLAGGFSGDDFSSNSRDLAGNFSLEESDDDFRDLNFDDTLLSDGSISSVLSSDEIFSQMEICSDFLEESSSLNNVGDIANANDILGEIKLEDYKRDDPIICDIKQEIVEESISNFDIPDSHLVDLERVEFDIAKLKQEVDTTSDDDSMWSDFFCEDDSSEISKEYDDLLKSLLTTPVDDFDLTLNVFNNVDEEEERTDESNSAEDKYCLDIILADHCYTLPWQESSVLLTPPNSSGDDSDPELEETSSQISIKKEQSDKFPIKTVKLKHKKDLKFVFSIKVKDGVPTSNKSLVAGRSLLKKNHPPGYIPPACSTSQLVRQVLQKRAYRKRHKLNEAAMAVTSLLNHEHRGVFQADRLLKMQTDREIHNSMERQRRIELKNEFDNLKTLIPEIAQSEKVSKLNVLNSSADYVIKLERIDLKLKLKKNQLKEKRQRLMEQLKLLGGATAQKY